MALQTCFALSSQGPYRQNNVLKSSLSSSCFSRTLRSIWLPISSLISDEKQAVMAPLSFSWSKRKLNLAILALVIDGSLLHYSSQTILALETMEGLERYTDATEGFTLLKPSSYVKVDKAGATVLFEEVNKGSNNIGVVVNPVRLNALSEFGTPQFVVDKLIQVEKRKESTKDAQVVGVAKRSGHGGLQVYEFEYKVDSTRGGMKRIFSAAFVASKKLYLLNVAHSDKPESPLDTHTRMMLEEVLHSFDVPYMT